MNLFICRNCEDIVKIIPTHKRYCMCGKSWGVYPDSMKDENTGLHEHAVFGGLADAFGIDNITFALAVSDDFTWKSKREDQRYTIRSTFFTGWFYKPGTPISMEHIHYEEDSP